MNAYELLVDEVYSLRKEGDGLRVTKFTKELNPAAFYHLTPKGDDSFTCNCPQSNRGPCKHLEIVEQFTFLYPERIDKGWFYCHQTGDWFPPVSDETAYLLSNPANAKALMEGIAEAEAGKFVEHNPPEVEAPPSGEGEAGPPQAPASPGAAEVDGSMPPESLSAAPKIHIHKLPPDPENWEGGTKPFRRF
jgi:hypothetical protein